jgi:predicted nuclease of predicted toxin-antitoxin system
MKLLLDENLSRRMVPLLERQYPGTTQVALAGLERAVDREIWAYAREHGFVIVTQDSDFHELSVLLGIPPKVLWLQAGNQSRLVIVDMLIDQREAIETALADESIGVLELFL